MKQIDAMLEDETRKLYYNLLTYGLEFFIDKFNEEGFRRAVTHIKIMISYFEDKEEYEKCTTLIEFQTLIIRIQTEKRTFQIDYKNK